MPMIVPLRKLKQEDPKLGTSPDFTVRSYQKRGDKEPVYVVKDYNHIERLFKARQRWYMTLISALRRQRQVDS